MRCDGHMMEDGIQPLEAMLYTIERINKNPEILPGIQLGALAFDTCDNPTYALDHLFYFIKGLIVRSDRFGSINYRCEDQSVPKFLNSDFDHVVAVLGAESSSVTIQVASVLGLFPIPQISYMATSPFLSNKEKFPTFFRTVPNDVNQARAMLEVLRQFQWSYVSVVYTDSEYGNHGYEMLVSLAAEYSICFSTQHRISKDHFKNDDYDFVVRNIVEKTDVKVVVLFAEKATTLRVLEAARRVDVGSRFVWLCSDAWPDHNDINYQQTIVLEGALAVQPFYAPLSGFDEYFMGLTLDHEQKNPWFREFWRTYHNCVYVEETKYFSSKKLERIDCRDPKLKIKRSNGYKQRRFLHFVRDAVYAVAYALHDMQRNVCGENWRGLCDKMRLPNEDIFQYLTKVSFKDEAGSRFGFVNEVDGPPRYSILNYQKMNGSYHWTVVGNYTLNEKEQPILQLDRDKLRFRGEQATEFPTSSCSHPCSSNHIMIRKEEDPCCWTCQSCGLYQYKVNEQTCKDCALGTIPTENGTGCDPIPEEFVEYSNPWAIVAIIIAVSGNLRQRI